MKLLATAPKYLSDATAPLTILNYLMGLRVFTYPRGKAGIVLSLIYLLLLLGIHCVTVNMTHEFYLNVKLLKLEYVLYEFMVYVNAIVVASEMILSWIYTKRLNACYRKIAQVDETLRQLGSMFNYKEIYFLISGALTIWFVYILISSILVAITLPIYFRSASWVIGGGMYDISVSFVVILEFSVLVKCLEMKFKLVNELLSEGAAIPTTEGMKLGLCATEDYAKIMATKQSEQRKHIFSIKGMSQVNQQLQFRKRSSMLKKHNLVKSWTRSRLPSQLQKQFQIELQAQSGNQVGDINSIRRSIVTPECQKRKHLLQTIRQVHLELCRISKTLCTSFGAQITSEIGVSIMFITGALYNLYIRKSQQRNNLKETLTDNLYVVISVGITYVLKIIIINVVCKNATCEEERTAEIIHAIHKYCKDDDIREEIQQFGLQILQNPVVFFAFGVSLNYQMLCTSLKTVTTYMVIMIQMSNSLESSETFEEGTKAEGN